MDLNNDGDRGEKGKTPEREPGSGSASSGVHGCNGAEHYDPDPHRCATILDQ